MAGSLDIQTSGQTFKVSSPDKVYFPEDGITKREVVEYFTTGPIVRSRFTFSSTRVVRRSAIGFGSPPAATVTFPVAGGGSATDTVNQSVGPPFVPSPFLSSPFPAASCAR